MYNIIPLILILISLGVIVFIVIKKFPALANLDIENMPAEKEAKFKEQIIGNRLKRNLVKWNSKVTRMVKPIGEASGDLAKWANKKLIEMRDSYKKELEVNNLDLNNKINQLFREIDDLIKKEELAEAEKRLIEIIGLDNRNIKAFRMLGDLYLEKKSFEEAKQTFEYILKLKENEATGETSREDGLIYFDLALACQSMDDLETAIANLQKALNIEPNSPRYLDTMLEMSIIKKDKVLAEKAYDKLKEVNPDNQKLSEFKKKIDEL